MENCPCNVLQINSLQLLHHELDTYFLESGSFCITFAIVNEKHTYIINTMENTHDVQLTEHFTLQEFLRSGTAITYGIDNKPTARDIANLRSLCRAVLEPLRHRFGRIIITSGFRCKELNKRVGGAENSQHLRGEAADIYVGNPEIAQKYASFIAAHTDYDQLIYEPAVAGGNKKPHWLHVSHTNRRRNRHQII